MSTTNRKRRTVLTAAIIALGIGATTTYALLPGTNIDPASIPGQSMDQPSPFAASRTCVRSLRSGYPS